MFFNPRIEAWLYKVTNTTSPEYKSELHATNGKKNGYSQVPTDDAEDSESKEPEGDGEEKSDVEKEAPEEKTDVEKGAPEKEKEDQGKSTEQEEKGSKDRKGFSGKQFPCHAGAMFCCTECN